MIHRALVGALLFLIFVECNAQHTPTRSYSNCAVVDVTNNITVQWTLLNQTHIALFVQGKAKGYVAVGFSEDGTMGNRNGTYRFADAWIVCTLSDFLE